MNTFHIIFKEIFCRKLNFFLGLLVIVATVAIIVGSDITLLGHTKETELMITRRELETERQVKKLQDDYRVMMKKLGYNILVLPGKQKLRELYLKGYCTELMKEETLNTLVRKGSYMIRHLLPTLTQPLHWNEKNTDIILSGIRGEVPYDYEKGRKRTKPLIDKIPKGLALVGYEIASEYNLKIGDEFILNGEKLKVKGIRRHYGNQEDAKIMIHLDTAQKLLNKPGMLSSIQALKCLCAGKDLSRIRNDLKEIIPEAQVIEKGKEVLVRAEARQRAAKKAQQDLDREKLQRQETLDSQARLTALLKPLLSTISIIIIALFFYSNAKSRRDEIGILRTIGVSRLKLMWLFISKAIIMGLLGAVLGFLIGQCAGYAFDRELLEINYINWQPLVQLSLITPLAAIISSFIPAYLAVHQDPAKVLREE